MELSVAISLIEKGIDKSPAPQKWADLGAGKGLFTHALASLLPAQSAIVAVDKSPVAFAEPGIRLKDIHISSMTKDFIEDDLGSEMFDGILMANSLHFVSNKPVFIQKLLKSLKTGGRLLLVEYDMDSPNSWVPYPISFQTLQNATGDFGFKSAVKLMDVPSVYQRSIYSALLTRGK